MWFNLAAATCVESRKPTGFIFPTIDIEFVRSFRLAICKPFCNTHWVYQACLFYGYTKPNKLFFMWYTSNLQATMNKCKYQYRCTGTGYTPWTPRQSHLRVYKGRNPRFFLHSQKSGWVSQRAVIRQTIQRTFDITLFATYSPSLFAGPCEFPSINLAITSKNGPQQLDFPTPTFFFDTARVGHHQKGAVVQTLQIPCTKYTKSYI